MDECAESLRTGYVSGKEEVEELTAQFTQLKTIRDQVFAYLEAGDDSAAFDTYYHQYEPQSLVTRDALEAVISACKADVKESVDTAATMSKRIVSIMFILAGCMYTDYHRALDPYNEKRIKANPGCKRACKSDREREIVH